MSPLKTFAFSCLDDERETFACCCRYCFNDPARFGDIHTDQFELVASMCDGESKEGGAHHRRRWKGIHGRSRYAPGTLSDNAFEIPGSAQGP
jgi:hypothetical protein